MIRMRFTSWPPTIRIRWTEEKQHCHYPRNPIGITTTCGLIQPTETGKLWQAMEEFPLHKTEVSRGLEFNCLSRSCIMLLLTIKYLITFMLTGRMVLLQKGPVAFSLKIFLMQVSHEVSGMM